MKAQVGDYLQFIRNGYFCLDNKTGKSELPTFNRTVTLKDSWAKLKQKMGV